MTLRVVEYTASDPADNLALEEVILDSVETGQAPSTLRFWESRTPFVVLGVSQVLAVEADEVACHAAGVPILRRCSAGGAVLQGPGSLNFALSLRYDDYPETRTLHGSYDYILNRIAAALSARGVPARMEGVSDLAIHGRKVSGNAQKRRKHAFLHHGTLLYAVNQDLMARCLREPSQRPDYRGERRHDEFVMQLPLTRDELVAAVCEAFGTSCPKDTLAPIEMVTGAALADSKYRDAAWTRRR